MERLSLLRSQRVPSKPSCGRKFILGKFFDPPIVVSTYSRQSERLESFKSLFGPQWAGYAITKIIGGIDLTFLNVSDDSFQSGKISVDC